MKSRRILIITTVCNEGPFLLEWIAHHRALGVTDFLVFSNDCTDGTDILLDRLATTGWLTHVRQTQGQKSVQWQALKLAAAHPILAQADWAMCIDCDEFVVLKSPAENLTDLIDRAQADAIILQWRLFGHSGHLTFVDEPVAQRFTQAAPEVALFPAVTRFFKTLYRVKNGPFRKPGVHRPKQRQNARPRWVDGAGREMPDEFVANDDQIVLLPQTDPYAMVQLNHYSLRSAEDFMVKRRRGLPNRRNKKIDATYWAERNFNNVTDTSIQRHADTSRVALRGLIGLPGVADAHDTSVKAHSQAIEDILSDPDEVTLFTRIALLQTSVPPDKTAAQMLFQRFHGARAPKGG
ncbi:glycosyltransferase family 2 protein [Pseudaestuariivita rosea]|uniref:glycosyltransferase family 2 protein n=1 Tax=Pseudaestuariivita rosea TaxID=2763263 RepID=UPI001ABB797A|nr:glycosyltransferase family 2 protein [Pseudaestuariivita rosea]